MNADQISSIVNNVQKRPYQTILISGDWGIGKTYEILNAIKGKSNIYMVSLFGSKQSEDIFKELLIKVGGSKIAQKSKLLNGKEAMKFEEAFKSIMPLTSCLVNKLDVKMDFGAVSKEIACSFYKNSEDSIIIFDDLERVSETFSFESFLGFIEELRTNKKLRIVLVANIQELPEGLKQVFDRFNEKVVDKIYNIDGISTNIDWESMGIEEAFIKKFNGTHGIRNLRTIEKAQKFYQDVLGQIDKIDDIKYMNSIKQLCYSIVTEDVEEIYLRQLEEKCKMEATKMDITKSISYGFDKEYISNFQLRISKFYLEDISCSVDLINEIYNYYISNKMIKQDIIVAGYEYFKRIGEKRNFYKSDEEIKQTIEILRAELYDNHTVIGALEKIDVIAQWMEVFEADTSEILDEFKNYIYTYIEEMLINGNDVSIDLFGVNLESNNVKEMVIEIEDKLPILRIEKTVARIMKYIKMKNYNLAYECIEKLEQYISIYNVCMTQILIKLLDDNILPLGSIEPIHWRYLHRVYKLCSNENYGIRKELIDFTGRAMKQYSESKVFKYRMELLNKKYLTVKKNEDA